MLLSTWLLCPLASATSAPLLLTPIASRRINPSGLLLVLVPKILVLLLVPLEMLPPQPSVSLSLQIRSLRLTRSPCSSSRPTGPAPRPPRTFALTVASRATGLVSAPRRRSRLSVVAMVLVARVVPFVSLRVPDLLETLATGPLRALVRSLGSPWPLRQVNPRPRSKMVVLGAGVLSVDAGRLPMVPPSIPALPEDRLPRPMCQPRPTIFILCLRLGMSRSFSFRHFGIF